MDTNNKNIMRKIDYYDPNLEDKNPYNDDVRGPYYYKGEIYTGIINEIANDKSVVSEFEVKNGYLDGLKNVTSHQVNYK